MTPIAPVRLTCVPPHAERSKPSNVDQSKRAFPQRFLAQRQLRGLFGVTRSGSPPAGPPTRCGWLRLLPRRSPDRELSRKVDGRRLRAEVEAHRAHAEQAIDRCRQHVLAGVLLHVVEAALPID